MRVYKQRGSVLVELTLVFLVWAALVIGIADVSQCLFVQQSLLERVRYAARWGAVTSPTDTTAIRNMVLYLQPTPPTDGRAAAFGLSDALVSVSTADPHTENYRLIVKVSGYSLRLLSPVVPATFTGATVQAVVPLGSY